MQYLLIYVSPFLLSGIPWSIHLITRLHSANETACETSRDKPASLSSSTCLIYAFGLRLPFGLCYLLLAYPPQAPYIRFLFVRLRFRYPFFSPTSHDVYLGSCYGVRRQLRPLRTFTTD